MERNESYTLVVHYAFKKPMHIPCKNIIDAREKFNKMHFESGLGASAFDKHDGDVIINGTVKYTFSYNGRLWENGLGNKEIIID